jgi:osmotically-inducible protein OsmY
MKSDANLQRDVLDELEWDPSIDGSQIGVTAKEGVVTLTGHLPNYSAKQSAEEAAKRVHGVRGVANEIEVRAEGTHAYDDEEIAAAAIHALQWDAKVPDTQLQVSVENGWIRVEGTVERRFQKRAVERVLSHLRGARGLTNDIQIVPVQPVSEIQSAIEAAFQRSSILDSAALSVEVDDAKVVITGDVHSHDELKEVERTAWAHPGVRDVQNCVTITPWGYGPAEEWGY